MILSTSQHILRVQTVKRMYHDGNYEMWTNRHDFLFEGDFQEHYSRAVLEKVALAELHMLMPQVETLFQVGYWFSALNFEGAAFKAVANFHRQSGGRHIEFGDTPVEWPLALMMKVFPEYGRAGKLMFRGWLRERDVRRSEAAGAQLRGDYDESQLSMNYFRAFMRESPYPSVVCDFPANGRYPVGARLVKTWGAASAVRLSSVEDAQRRKTFKATPYRQDAHNLADTLTLAGQIYSEVLLYDGLRIPFERVRQLVDVVRPVQTVANNLVEYWEEGIEEAIAPCWRPTAGKDPEQIYGRAALDDMINSLAQLVGMLSEIQPDDEDRVDRREVNDLFPLMEKAAAQYVLMMNRTRFTGTPIPHPNIPGTCG